MKATTNSQTGYLCHCLRITVEDYETMIREGNHADFATLKERHGIGSMCSSCEYEAKGILLESAMLAGVSPLNPKPRQSMPWWSRLVGKKEGREPIRPPGLDYQTGIFFMRKGGLESRLALSNLAFPEHTENANGKAVRFTAELFGSEGNRLAISNPKEIPSNDNFELSLDDLFPNFQEDFIGSLYVKLEDLQQTGSLRPYGIIVSNDHQSSARCHYHDKFGRSPEPGFVQNSSPFEPGQECWMALANCQNLPYETDVFLKVGTKKHAYHLSIPPMGACWLKLADLFPEAATTSASPTLFWLDSAQHVMVYFLWFNTESSTWTCQHH